MFYAAIPDGAGSFNFIGYSNEKKRDRFIAKSKLTSPEAHALSALQIAKAKVICDDELYYALIPNGNGELQLIANTDKKKLKMLLAFGKNIFPGSKMISKSEAEDFRKNSI